MTEKSSESTQLTSDKIPNSGDMNNVLPNLSEAKGPVSLTLHLDKSVGKVASWIIGAALAGFALIGAGIVLAVWMVIAYTHTERETELLKYYVLEMDAKLIAAGVKKSDESVAGKLEESKK